MATINEAIKIILSQPGSSDIHLIGVAGSIGRGEKAVSDKNLNDVDFVVVKDTELRNKNVIERELNKLFGTKYTDILILSRKRFISRFSKRCISQSDYDLIRELAPYYLSGWMKERIYNISPRPNQKVILSSAVAVLATRGWILAKENWSVFDSLNISLQLRKFGSAIVDAVLIVEGKYFAGTRYEKIKAFSNTQFFLVLSQPEAEQILLIQSGELELPNEELRRYYISILDKIGGDYLRRQSLALLAELFASSFIFFLRCASRGNLFPLKDFIRLMRVKDE